MYMIFFKSPFELAAFSYVRWAIKQSRIFGVVDCHSKANQPHPMKPDMTAVHLRIMLLHFL